MKLLPLLTLLLAPLALPFTTVQAQDAPPGGGGAVGGMREFMSSLTPQEKMQFMKARKQVLAANPDLKTEGENLLKEKQQLGDNPSPEDRRGFFQDVSTHEGKMREAMLKVDPSLSPVFAKIDQSMKQKIQERMQQAGTAKQAN